MRSTLVLVLFSVVACGGSSNNNKPADMAMSTNHDLSMLSTACDVAAQDCGSASLKCVSTVDSNGAVVSGACVPNGTVAVGATCTMPTSTTMMLDDCKAGLFCDGFNVIGTPVCRTICTDDTMCPTGQRCLDGILQGTVDFGWCIPTCTPFSSTAGNCPAGADCGDNFSDFGDENDGSNKGFFICKTTGHAGVYEDCMSDADCAAGFWCGFIDQTATSASCLPNCDATHDCITPPTDAGAGGLSATCTPYDDTPNGAGWCSIM